VLIHSETAGTHVQLAVVEAANGAVQAQSIRLAQVDAAAAKGDAREKAQLAVAGCDAFVLVLTPGVLDDETALAAIDGALKEGTDMPLVVVCEAEARAPALCTRCKSWPAALAIHGVEGQPPTRCAAHIKPGLWRVDEAAEKDARELRDRKLYDDEGTVDLEVAFARAALPPVVATIKPSPDAASGSAPAAEETARLKEQAAKTAAALAKAATLAKRFIASGRATAVPWSVDVDFEQAAAALVLRSARKGPALVPRAMFAGLACRSITAPEGEGEQAQASTAAPPADDGGSVCILYDGSQPAAKEASEQIQRTLSAEFKELSSVVLVDASEVGGFEAATKAGRGAKSVLLFLTAGLLEKPVAGAFLTASLRGREDSAAHVVVAHHQCGGRGGAPVFEDLMRQAPEKFKMQGEHLSQLSGNCRTEVMSFGIRVRSVLRLPQRRARGALHALTSFALLASALTSRVSPQTGPTCGRSSTQTAPSPGSSTQPSRQSLL
jgi:hypothetical protein